MFRADRLATLYVFRPLRQQMGSRRRPRIPILMYHSVSEHQSNGSHPYFKTATSPQVFAEHMRFLSENGYRTLHLDDAVHCIGSGQKPHERSVVLTFDDGFQDFATHAFPVLARYGFTATVFLPTGYIANERRRFNDRDCLTWQEVREMDLAGVTFGSHTVTHPQLRSLKADEEVERELRWSKATIEDELGHAVDSFSYPFAFPETDRYFTRNLRDLLEEQGYRNGVSTIIGTAGAGDDEFFLPRLPVNSWDDPPLFRAKLAGDYDWLHLVQYATKLAKFGVS